MTDSPDYKLASFMFEKILTVAPLTKQPDFNKWSNTIRLIREKDKIPITQITEIFLWANQDSFWQTNILSPDKLRKQIPKLDAQRTKVIYDRRDQTNRPDNKKLSLVERVKQNCERDLEELRRNE